MGSAVSKNITKAATEAIAKVSNNIIQNSKLTTDQTQIISVTDIDGDVNISGNTFTQKATINMKSLMNVLVQEDIQQALTQEIAQTCKSIVSGLNIFQFPNAQNEINVFLKASSELMNTISSSCASSMSENQVITVSRVKGTVNITNNVMSQMADIFQSCIQEAVSKNTIFQQLQQKIDQSATAKAEGLDLWQIIILIALVLGVPFVSVIGGVAVVGRYLFPLSILAGAGCLVAYYSWVEENVYSHAFSSLIRNLPNCNARPLATTSNAYTNSSAAAQACANNRNCVAFDWQGAVIDQLGNHISFNPPQTTFYSSIGPGCEQAIVSSPDHSKVFRNPIFVKGSGPPIKAEGDVYLNILTAEYYFFDQSTRQWVKQGSFAHSDFTSRNSINWGTVPPTPATQGVAGSIYVYYAASDPVYFHIYVKNPDGWKLYPTPLRGPGLIPDAPSNINVTGFTTVKHRNWLLYLGGALLIVGILGSVVAFASKKPVEKLPSLSPSPSQTVRRSTNPFDEDED
ncbi:Lipid membrane protein [Invertebrate iridescent virus 30]|uniref:Lipid membrane protein n=1 Tax=Invertebrate iridescent virus 30 TaxID=345585 RepID=W8W1R0_9VIRU|nr:Lipid membrane protein [Invertebrate iridescent virus 30]CCV02267.1 Lipid membrane protein [Invertebrate iridescent virus 30]